MLSLILPYWERQEATDKALGLIADRYFNLIDLEIVIVDDGSPVSFRAPADYPLPLRVIRLTPKSEPKNPCVPINVGVAEAAGDIIVLSNPEVLHTEMAVLPGMLDELDRLGPDGYVLAAAWCPEQGDWHCHSSIASDRPSGERQPPGSGFHFCAMLHRSLWDKAGGFDEAYRDGAGYDDPDWVNRLARAGAKFCIRDDLVVIHPKVGATTNWPAGAFERNRALFMSKWQRSKSLLNVVCVKHGAVYGSEYVNRLYAMVARNLEAGTEGWFICYTDDATGIDNAIHVRELPADLRGWWGKLYLFAPGQFEEGERVLFFDLDTLILGPLDDIARYEGEFAILRDFYRPNGWGSGVMAWRGGWGARIWEQWNKAGRPETPGGDQAWIERCLYGDSAQKIDIWQDLFPGAFVSFKVHCQPYPPEEARVVCFHGEPKPHDCGRPWVASVWHEGELGGTHIALERNVSLEVIRANSRSSAERGLPPLTSKEAHGATVCIVGGGPSLAESVDELRRRRKGGAKIWALNGTHDWLTKRGLAPDAHVVLDARPENERFVRNNLYGTTYYVASQCHPKVYNTLRGCNVIRFDLDKLGDCGTTVGTHAICIAFVEGYRKIHLFGFDSSYRASEGHAYEQGMNSRERIVDVEVGGQQFKAAPWMAQQAKDFVSLARDLVPAGVEIIVHGDGLIPYVARLLMQGEAHAAVA